MIYVLLLCPNKLLGPDVFHAGVATHYCESSKIPEIEKALLTLKNSNEVEGVINHFCPKPRSEFGLSKHLDQINKSFDASSIEEIISNLEEDNSEWARKTIKVCLFHETSLQSMIKMLISTDSSNSVANELESGPPSAKSWFQVFIGRVFPNGISFNHELFRRKRLSRRYKLKDYIILSSGKLYSVLIPGTRAGLVTKDKNPKWIPSRIEDVTEQSVLSFFQPLPNNDDLNM